MTEKQLEITTATNIDIPILKTLAEEYWRNIEEKYRPEDEKKITLGNLTPTLEYGYTYYQPGYTITGNDMIFIARLGDKVVGFTSLATDTLKKELTVYDFMIRQEFQAKGFGTELMQFVMGKAKALELDQIVLWVDDVNIAAKKLYQKFGFEFQNIEMLDWNDDKGETVLKTRSEEWRVSFTSG